MEFPGYHIDSQISEGRHFVLWRATQLSSGTPVILKSVHPTADLQHAAVRLRREHRITSLVQHTGVVPVLQIFDVRNTPVLVKADVGGSSLSALLAKGPLTIDTALAIAQGITEALVAMHELRIVHRDVKPGNVIVDLDNNVVALTDLDIAIHGAAGDASPSDLTGFDGSVAYISPEQTGRINRPVDHRSDLYSLGITLYEMLAGRTPFDASDILDCVHAHIARTPPPLLNVPAPVADVVTILLAKSADDRYQGASGLLHDLRLVREHVAHNGSAPLAAPLRSNDHGNVLRVPSTLYGREAELQRLASIFDECLEGPLQIVTVAGYSGVGKSSVVNELQGHLVQHGAWFIKGKSDQFGRSTSLGIMLAAVDKLARITDAQPEDLRQAIVASIANACGDLLGTICARIGTIRNWFPDVQASDNLAFDSVHRLQAAIVACLRGVGDAGVPLLVFLDDLQWADGATLTLLEQVQHLGLARMTIVLSYRDNEVTQTHPVAALLRHLADVGTVHSIHLEPLGFEASRQLVADTLQRPTADVQNVAERLWRSTGGNPFFLRQALTRLHEAGAIRRDATHAQWTWDDAAVEEMSMTDNVLDLMAQRLASAPALSKRILLACALFGDTVPLCVACVVEAPYQEVARAIQALIEDGYVTMTGPHQLDDISETEARSCEGTGSVMEITFAHDRIRQAAYQLGTAEDRIEVHNRIANLYANGVTQPSNAIAILIAHHTVECMGAGSKDTTIRRLLEGGKAALAESAVTQAQTVLRAALTLLPAGDAHAPRERVAVLTMLAKAEYLLANFDAAEAALNELDTSEKDIDTLVASGEIRQRIAFARIDIPEAVRHTMGTLVALGVAVPKGMLDVRTLVALLRVQAKLRGCKPEDFQHRKALSNRHIYTAIRLIGEISSALYYMKSKHFGYLLVRQMELTVDHGNHALSGSAMCAYGIVRLIGLGDVDGGYAWSHAGINMPDTFSGREFRAKNIVSHGLIVQHRKEHLDETYQHFRAGYAYGLEMGYYDDMGLAAVGHIYHSLYQGKDLAELEQHAQRYIVAMRDVKQERTERDMLAYLDRIQALRDPVTPVPFDRPWFNTVETIDSLTTNADYTLYTSHYLNHAWVSYVCQHIDHAAHCYEKAAVHEDSLTATLSEFIFSWLDVLLSVAKYSPSDSANAIQRKMGKRLKKMRMWAKRAPMNYGHMLHLAEAELFRIANKDHQAEAAYHKAITLAFEHRFVMVEALAREHHGRYLMQRQRVFEGIAALRSARECYRQWGAMAKVRQLEVEFETLRESSSSTETGLHAPSVTHATTVSGIDLTSVLRASQAIAAEISHERLLSTTLSIVTQNMGAERSALLLERDGRLNLAARNSNDGADDNKEFGIPQSVIDYVLTSNHAVVVNDAQTDERFADDNVIRRRSIRSIVCAPVLHQSKRIGIIYVENNLTSHAFPEERLHVLTVLTSQAAISLENAELYRNLEQKVAERTQELQQTNVLLDEERQRAQTLLHSILPAGIVQRLQQGETTIADHSDDVSVMFADIVNFTALSRERTPGDVVSILNDVFNTFDDIVARYKLEKIKTIGDAYMVVSGLPHPRADHAAALACCAADLLSATEQLAQQVGVPDLGIRIGIHAGPVVAGVIGRSKPVYDLWGDTVNLAARMEGSGVAGRIHVTQDFKNILQQQLPIATFEERGTVQLKGIGSIATFFVKV